MWKTDPPCPLYLRSIQLLRLCENLQYNRKHLGKSQGSLLRIGTYVLCESQSFKITLSSLKLKDLLRYCKGKHIVKNKASPKAFFSLLFRGMLDPKEMAEPWLLYISVKWKLPATKVGLEF